ncbi:MAG: DegT/DnrJ/EryC1/StrS family aminotransferase [Candidatus Omnitrophica bacterium]|nr:DegT/DnrJ/EryC1/StrS family aminotransferase [Candidatus Omnitrophota bacterium]
MFPITAARCKIKKRINPSALAINGGPKVRLKPLPGRGLLGPEEKAAVDALFDEAIASGEAFGYNGPAEEEYCREFTEFMGGGYADAVNSGTSGVYVALHALNPEPFTEIIVSPITDCGGMMPITLLNCIPIIADTEPNSYNTGPDQIEKLISPLTSAILVAHIGGEPADIKGIVAVAKKHHIPVIEDCAQSPGAKINGRLVGTFGKIASFSTMFGKHFCTGGQGGMVYTENEDLYWKSRQVSDRGKPFGLPTGSTNSIASLNFNLDDLAATIGRVQLKKLPGILAKRRKIVAQLREEFKKLRVVSIPTVPDDTHPAYWFLRLRFHPETVTCDKETYCQSLTAEGMPVNPNYNALPHTYDWYKNRSVFGTSGYPWTSPRYKGDPNQQFPCPNARAAISRHFNLGISESWSNKDVASITAALKKTESVFLK